MKEVNISDNVTKIVDAKKIIDKVTLVNDRYETSKARTKYLLSHINSAKNSIDKVYRGEKGNSWGSLDKDALLDLIKDVNNASSKSISSISELIINNNENSKLLAEMITALAMLSGLSFEKISETTAELEEIASQINDSTSGNEEQGKQIKRIVVSQIEKIKEEKKRADRIEYNFSVINENLRGFEKGFKFKNDGINNKIEEIESGLVKTIKSQKYKISLLYVFSITNLLIILGFIIYFFVNQY
ncbi:hypothetical protein [Marivirga sp.]|uniref:hypothetical protein n=1 Tax=Marivirga sp. TaxID=2018662 RepID=UPI0025FDC13D|nr:hypothetical protein [Marivirga sp.]